mmetsp:Transcript_14552/g.43218  ORF Transcript_14552/g.43218 Transcript_14552/m.43218 type:complete len:264 (+) Transcript_14552:1218-2009(+)
MLLLEAGLAFGDLLLQLKCRDLSQLDLLDRQRVPALGLADFDRVFLLLRLQSLHRLGLRCRLVLQARNLRLELLYRVLIEPDQARLRLHGGLCLECALIEDITLVNKVLNVLALLLTPSPLGIDLRLLRCNLPLELVAPAVRHPELLLRLRNLAQHGHLQLFHPRRLLGHPLNLSARLHQLTHADSIVGEQAGVDFGLLLKLASELGQPEREGIYFLQRSVRLLLLITKRPLQPSNLVLAVSDTSLLRSNLGVACLRRGLDLL